MAIDLSQCIKYRIEGIESYDSLSSHGEIVKVSEGKKDCGVLLFDHMYIRTTNNLLVLYESFVGFPNQVKYLVEGYRAQFIFRKYVRRIGYELYLSIKNLPVS